MQGSNGIQIPDATLGLCTYDRVNEPWILREDLMDNDRVKLFEKEALIDILEHFELQGPYSSNSTKFGTAPFPMFGFGLWEAKKVLGDNHAQAFVQTARKLATLLRWQRAVFQKAKCEDCRPLVWFFSSVGSSWEICGCYDTKDSRSEGYRYVSLALSS